MKNAGRFSIRWLALVASPALSIATMWLMGSSIAFSNPTSEGATHPTAIENGATYAGGRYHRDSPSSSDLTIIETGARWRITISGAGIPNGGATAADCTIDADGAFRDGKLFALEESASDANYSHPGSVAIKLYPLAAIVEHASVDDCGMGRDLTGRYSLIGSATHQQASIRCTNVTTRVDRLVCVDQGLLELDAHLGESYRAALSDSSDPAAFRNQQKNWIAHTRNTCFDVECVKTVYRQGIEELAIQ